LEARAALPDSIRVLEMTIDDSWLRDSGPTVMQQRKHLLTEKLLATMLLCCSGLTS
jgi:agmatine/peptidylarginine deiminase